MKLDIRFRGFTPAIDAKELITKRVLFHLERFEQMLLAVQVRVSDVNGPKGGLDKRCQVTVHTKGSGTATIVTTGIDSNVAVDDTLHRITEALGRKVKKTQTLRTLTPSLATRGVT
jgi:putative sigma-54 modulation protein